MKFAKYFAFFSAAFKSHFAYRLSAALRFFTSAMVVFVQFSLWKTLTGSGLRPDVTLADMAAFIAITEVAGALTRGDFANELGASIRDGSVIMHFIRPASYQLYLLSSFMGNNLFRFVSNAVPVVLLCAVTVGLPLPLTMAHLGLFAAFTLLGILIMFELIYITGLLAFWTQTTWFLSWYVGAFSTFFGGTIVPLWFYPHWLERLSVYLPFRYISFEGINYYLGKAPLSSAGFSLSMAILWAFFLFLAGQLVWFAVQRKMTINGG